jgi:hypothetical protein
MKDVESMQCAESADGLDEYAPNLILLEELLLLFVVNDFLV